MHQNLIRPGDESYNVTRLQTFLKENFTRTSVNVSGVFGLDTVDLVKQYQKIMKLVPDGIVGKLTIASMKLDLTPAYLTNDDYESASNELGIETAIVKAVADVETRSTAFWKDQSNKTPILFERHVFDRLLIRPWQNGPTLSDLYALRLGVRDKHPDICNPRPGGYGLHSAQYPKLQKACSISDTVGLMSASWGTFQIMGFHAPSLKYNSVQAFVRAMQASQFDHLKAFLRFIKLDSKMVVALRRKNWTQFAKLYNGAGQKGYDVKLESAYDRYK